MNDRYSHRERLEMIIKGETPDRPAASIWRHFYDKESKAEGLAEAMLAFQKKFDWDFMKINPRASYHVEDWGNKLEWSTDEMQKHKKIEFAVKDTDDWDKIEPMEPTAPVLSQHLRAIEIIKKKSDPELPLLMTIFNPLGIARYLVGSQEKLLEHLKADEQKVITALENITVTFVKYAQECRNAGADGLFYATLEWASSDWMTYDDYSRLCRPLDLRIIKAAGSDALNILHVCHSNNYLDKLIDYPVPLFNWDSSDPTNPSVEKAFKFAGEKTLIAGLDDKGWLWHSRPVEIRHEVKRLKMKFADRKFIFGPGCAVEPAIPDENFTAVREAL